MSEVTLRQLMLTTRVEPQIDIEGPVVNGMEKVLGQRLLPEHPELVYRKATDPVVKRTEWVASFLGETLAEAVTRMENSLGIRLAAVPTPEGGFELYLEQNENAVE